MAVLQPQHRRSLAARATAINQCVKQLRSGRLVRPWTQAIEVSRLKIIQRRREQRKKQQASAVFPFMKLPTELRLEVYSHLIRASSKITRRRALAKLRPHASSALRDGTIVIRKTKDSPPRLHSRSAVPALAILQTCQQIRMEALPEIYKCNNFEVVARTQRRPAEMIFNLPGFLRLDLLRELILVTHAEVSRFESCFAYDVFRHITSLRKLSVAMKTTSLGGGPCFHSCLEALNLVLWISPKVEVDFCKLEDLLHHDHPAWVNPLILSTYFTIFVDLRGAGLNLWSANVAIAYDKGLQIAKSFSIAYKH